MILTILTILISIGYSALNKNLSISGEAFLRAHGNVRITGLKSSSSASEGYETYTPEYSKRGTKVFSTLPNIDSKINYTVQMNNTTGVKYKFDSVTVSSTNPNIECIPSVGVGTIIEVGVSSFTIEVKYKDGITIDEKTDICEIKYEFSVYDITPPTLRIETITDGETSKTVKITAADNEEGSGLSEENNYKYYFSTSNTELVGGEWTTYKSGEEIVLEGLNQAKYLWVYPIKDRAGNINDNKTNTSNPYWISWYNFASTYTISYNTNGKFNYFEPKSSELTYNSFSNKENDCIHIGEFILYDIKANDRIKLAFTVEYSNIEVDTSQGYYGNHGQGTGDKNEWSPGIHFSDFVISGSGTYNYEGYLTLSEEQANNTLFYIQLRTDRIKSGSITIKNIRITKETIVLTQSLKFGSNLSELPTATNVGYTFAGWYTSQTGATEVTTNTTVPASNTTYYAHWNPNNYNISFNSYYQLNYFEPKSSELTYNSFSNKENDCIHIGEFILYDIKANDRIKLAFTVEYSNIEVDTSQGYYGNHGQGTGDKNEWSPGIHFSDFVISGSGTYNYEGYLTLSEEQANNTLFYIQLRTDRIKSGSITIKNIRITKETTVTTQSLQVESRLTNLPTPTYSQYVFTGWYTEPSGGKKVTSDTLVPPKDTTYYAHWTPNTYTLTVNPNGGIYNGDAGNTVISIQYGSTTTLTNPTRSGYVFAGWTLSGAGSSLNGTTFTMGYENATLTANWATIDPVSLSYTGAAQYYTAPATGNYEITLYGAKGGNGGLGLCSGGSGGAGGNGGYVKATVRLTQGQTYTIWVGGKGTDSSYGDTQEGTGGLSDGKTGGTGSNVSGGGGGGGGSSYIALGSTVYLRANGGGGGGGGADGGWYRKSNGSTTCGGCKYRNMGAAGARGGNGGGGTLGGSGAANTCQASGYAGSNGTYYINQSYSTLVESGSTGTGDGKAIIKHIS